MKKEEYDKLKISDTVFYKSKSYGCIVKGYIAAIYPENIYIEIHSLIYENEEEMYNGRMTVGVNKNSVYLTKEEAENK